MMIGKDNQRYAAKRDDDDEEDEDFSYENEINARKIDKIIQFLNEL